MQETSYGSNNSNSTYFIQKIKASGQLGQHFLQCSLCYERIFHISIDWKVQDAPKK